MSMTIVIGNKNYSSWSLRAWLVLEHFGFAYDEQVIPLDEPETGLKIRQISPSGRVPCLIDEGMPVWESLAIIEYLAEKAPRKNIWPERPAARAMARCVSAEMHAGFAPLRRACPMNLRKSFPFRDWGGEDAAADVKRIEQIWKGCLERWGGPFLFGAFCGADAMFAPVATRLKGYGWPMRETSEAYVGALYDLPAFRKWHEAGVKEPWTVPKDEIAFEPV